jgi:hypothetical protein
MSWEFVRWVWTYPSRRRPGILERLDAVRGEKQVVILASELRCGGSWRAASIDVTVTARRKDRTTVRFLTASTGDALQTLKRAKNQRIDD